MTTNRLVEKEKAAAYASVLLNGAQEQGGQDAVMEVLTMTGFDDLLQIEK